MLQVIDTRKQPVPNWDYINRSLLKEYPIITYYSPTKNKCIYTIKCITKDTTYADGYVYIMSEKDLPHQGSCINCISLINHKIKSSISPVHPNDISAYKQSGLPSWKY